MTTMRTIKPFIVSLVSLAAVACSGAPDTDALRSVEGAASPADAAESPAVTASAPKVVAAEPAPAVADWRPWVEAEVERLRAQRPDYYDAVMTMPARTTRAGFPRFTGPQVRDPEAAPILLHRLLSKGEPSEIRAAIVEALPRTSGDYSAAAAELLTLETDPRVRELLVGIMHRAQAPYALQGLERGLSDANPAVRAEAARAAGRRTESLELAPKLIAALTDTESKVQIEAARALGNLQAESAKEALVGRLSSDSAQVRRHALRALSRIDAGFARALPQLETLRADADPKVARVAETIASGG